MNISPAIPPIVDFIIILGLVALIIFNIYKHNWIGLVFNLAIIIVASYYLVEWTIEWWDVANQKNITICAEAEKNGWLIPEECDEIQLPNSVYN